MDGPSENKRSSPSMDTHNTGRVIIAVRATVHKSELELRAPRPSRGLSAAFRPPPLIVGQPPRKKIGRPQSRKAGRAAGYGCGARTARPVTSARRPA
ncbi:hypothetical protein EVAR_3411_1 [Eumeta japonica]|uniref:Uncharacterized protein n=1 Tax=Eumeta variegata TaxID=151549 RepID=A0A4C1SUQ4_EUMVA|nr:hypothetical protein EVAR_3411_1 [Eumeta japonica]